MSNNVFISDPLSLGTPGWAKPLEIPYWVNMHTMQQMAGTAPTPGAMILQRLAWGNPLAPGQAIAAQFDDLHAYLSADKAYVFVVVGGTATVIEDDRSLFPSDKLITQLRLLKA